MKQIAIAFIFFIIQGNLLLAQDMIQFKNGRRYPCNIVRVKNDTIYYFGFKDRKKRIKSVDIGKISVIFFQKRHLAFSNKRDFRSIHKIKVKKALLEAKDKNKPDTTMKKEALFDFNLKKKIGVGVDIVLQDKNQNMIGASLDLYLIKYFNVGIGIGYLYGNSIQYATGKFIFKRKNREWSPILDLFMTYIDKGNILKTNKPDIEVSNHIFYFIPSFGVEYKNKSGLSADIKLGASIMKSGDNTYFNSMSFSIRVGGHF